MNALSNLVMNQPIEKGGAWASGGFSYQCDWGMDKLLTLHKSGNDYIIVFDYHDDIVVLDGEVNLQNVDFYQIKTSHNNQWTINRLTKYEKGGHSILWKLLSHFAIISYTRIIYFVTNDYLSSSMLKIGSTSQNLIHFYDLKSTTQASIKKRLEKEDPKVNISKLDNLHFFINQLHYNWHNEIMIGRVSDFIKESNLSPDLKPKIFYDSLHNEIERKIRYATDITSADDLISEKSFTKKRFDIYLNEINNFETFKKSCESIVGILNNDKVSFKTIKELQRSWKEIQVDLMDYRNYEIRELIKYISSVYKTTEIEDDITLYQYCCKIYDMVAREYVNLMRHSEYYLKALILYIVNNE